jgi:hypothetical protein
MGSTTLTTCACLPIFGTTCRAEIKDMESEMEALSRENERMDALLLEAEKTKAETDKALAVYPVATLQANIYFVPVYI